MNASALDQIINAVLYEGYILYPYRSSSKKNSRERFTFGRVYPEAYSVAQNGAELCVMQTECLIECPRSAATVEVSARFLQPMWREIGQLSAEDKNWRGGKEPRHKIVPELMVAGKVYQTWQEAVEREAKLSPVSLISGQRSSVVHPFVFPAARTLEPITEENGDSVGVIVRRQERLEGTLEIETNPVAPGCFKVTVRVHNHTPILQAALDDRDAVMMRTFASTHTILRANGAEFVSLTDPPSNRKQLTESCKNTGTWPVLVGEEEKSERTVMLSSPIILPDYPRVAPESDGDFGDATEMDEMLTLRVLTMTDGEKREMNHVDGFARKILERTESMSPDHFMKMHGTMRDVKTMEDFFNPSKKAEVALVNGIAIKAGDKVLIRPKNRADAFDLMLAGKAAIVESVERDAENKIHLALVVEDDPGKDLGMLRQPGHRFFYGLDEVEPLKETGV